MSRARFRGGVLLASGLIGPIVAAPALFGPRVASDDLGTIASGAAAWLLLSAPAGFLLSFFPNLAGAWLLARLGERHRAGRWIVIWGLTGAVMAAPLGIWAGPTARGSTGYSVLSFAAIGLVSALLCRSRTRWVD